MHFFIPVFDKMKSLLSLSLFAGVCVMSMASVPSSDSDINVDDLHADFSAIASGEMAKSAVGTFIPDQAVGYEYVNRITGNTGFRRARRGILVVGAADTIRAMEPFRSSAEAELKYADVVNEYARRLGDSVRVYCMPVPTAVAFYCPDGAKSYTSATRPAMQRIFDALTPEVTPVDIFPTLGTHAAEPIYSRTDHHWAPLGAYYAAGCFAAGAEVPFATLDSYREECVPGYVGTMKKFSADPRVARAPENFVYHMPLDSAYSVTYRIYSLDKQRKNVIGESAPRSGKLFQKFKGASTYLTFLGGDTRLTEISTSVGNGRRLLILKDSFGNALPGYLTNSFEKIFVVDCRYFTHNIIDYMRTNGVTDLLFVNNLTHVVNPRTADAYRRYLEQRDPND